MKLPPGSKFFILAGVAGLAAVFLVHSYINKRVAVPYQSTSQVVVAEADIAPGTPLSSRLLRVVSWPTDIVPAKAVASTKPLEGRICQTIIAKGEPILLSKLAPEGTEAGLGGLLAPNHLAVTVKTDEVTGVGGFISPGDRVDVLAEMQSPKEGNEHYSKLILQNLKVLSKGQVWDQTADKKPQVVQTVTLEVAPQEAEVLNLASFQGRIRLALRHQQNKTEFSTPGIGTSKLCDFQQTTAPVVQKAAEQVHKEWKPTPVQIIKGMTMSSITPLESNVSKDDSRTQTFAKPRKNRLLAKELSKK